jgi:hypothetical protein
MRHILAVALAISVMACAERPPPVRTPVTEGTARDQEVLECHDQADRDQPVVQAARGALIGVPVGAGIGAIIGGLFFANPNPAIWTGALAGVEGANLERAVDECLRAREKAPAAPS